MYTLYIYIYIHTLLQVPAFLRYDVDPLVKKEVDNQVFTKTEKRIFGVRGMHVYIYIYVGVHAELCRWANVELGGRAGCFSSQDLQKC